MIKITLLDDDRPERNHNIRKVPYMIIKRNNNATKNMNNPSADSNGNGTKSLVIITGASRGIGRAIALAIADEIIVQDNGVDDVMPVTAFPSTPLHMVLISRSEHMLHETAQLVKERGVGLIETTCHEIDLSDLDTLEEKLQFVLNPLSDGVRYQSCWLVNNAGSLGPLGMASTFSGASTMKELRQAIDFNLTSTIWLSSQFAQKFFNPLTTVDDVTKNSPFVRIVNISSLCGIEPFSTMSIYCAGKAGREMFHRVLAKEHSIDNAAENQQCGSSHKHKQIFKTLNYAPGPCDTEMTDVLADSSELDENLHNFFVTSKRENSLVRVEETARKLVQILKSDEFESGTHIDYFDVNDDLATSVA